MKKFVALMLCSIMLLSTCIACTSTSSKSADASVEPTQAVAAEPVATSAEVAPTAEAVAPISIVCGGKGFTEQYILAWIMTILLQENSAHEVTALTGLSASAAANQALTDGDIDMFVDYTGGMFMNILEHEYTSDLTIDEILATVKKEYSEKFGFTVMERLGFNNTYCFAMTQTSWERFGKPKTYSDLIANDDTIRLGMDVTFRARSDGYLPLCKKYGFDFKNITEMEINLAYQALNNDDIDLIIGYATDGAISKYNLVVLKDDLNFFPPHYSVPIMRTEFYEAHPDVVEIISRLEGKFTDADMAELNAKVAVDLQEPEAVAREWLTKAGLI